MTERALRRAAWAASLVLAAFLSGCGGGAPMDGSSDSSADDNGDVAPQPSASIPPIQDVFVAEDQPGTNFNTNTASCGTCASMVMVMSASNTITLERWTLLKYDLSSLPHGPTQKLLILSAELHIQYLGGIAVNTDDDMTFNAYRCAQNWSELGVCWNNKPTRLGGSIGSAAVHGTQFDCYLPLNPSVVQEWINMPATNYGIILSGSGGNGVDSCKSMPSQEYNGRGITLDVNYTLQ